MTARVGARRSRERTLMVWRSLLCSTLLGTALAATPLAAQIRDLRLPARNNVSLFGALYTTVDAIYDPDTASRWQFGDNAFGAGAAVHRQVFSGLQLGVEGSWARTEFERVSTAGIRVAAGDADLFTGRVTARLQPATPGTIGGYLMGGLGFFGYHLTDPETTAWDVSLGTGAGVELRFAPRNGVFLEWDRLWVYHESDEIDGNDTGRHSVLRLGLRRGF